MSGDDRNNLHKSWYHGNTPTSKEEWTIEKNNMNKKKAVYVDGKLFVEAGIQSGNSSISIGVSSDNDIIGRFTTTEGKSNSIEDSLIFGEFSTESIDAVESLNNTLQEELNQTKQMREVKIKALDHGYIVEVGCAKIAFTNQNFLADALIRYMEDPTKVEKQWHEGTLFPDQKKPLIDDVSARNIIIGNQPGHHCSGSGNVFIGNHAGSDSITLKKQPSTKTVECECGENECMCKTFEELEKTKFKSPGVSVVENDSSEEKEQDYSESGP